MNMLLTKEELLKLKSRGLVPCQCKECLRQFFITKNLALRCLKGTKKAEYCSRQCVKTSKRRGLFVIFLCKYCGKEKETRKTDIRPGHFNFCNRVCANKFFGLRRRMPKRECGLCKKPLSLGAKAHCRSCFQTVAYNTRVKLWKEGVIKGYSGITCNASNIVKRFLRNKYNNRCSKCGWCEIHPITNKVPLEINHIDGDATNCREENLELLCPNCHSLTPNFRSLNRESKRKR